MGPPEFLLLVVLLALVLCVSSSSSIFSMRVFETNIPAVELNALHDLYNATNGDNWTWPSSNHSGVPWLFTPDANPCVDNWFGINCTTSSSLHILSIALPSQHLSGYIPDSLGNLSYLEHLQLANNPHLAGSIPALFANLSLLRIADFSNNNITGTIPVSLASTYQSLQLLMLDGNELTGTFPNFLCAMSQLIVLDLANNSMHGHIPSCIGQLTHLEGLSVAKNKFDGTIPSTIGDLTSMVEISFDTNAFTGPIPDTIGNLRNMTYFDAFETHLSGSLPVSICGLQGLIGLYLYSSYLSGPLPHCFEQMTSLKTFEANSNGFTGTLPLNTLSLPALQTFMIIGSHLTGTLPANMTTALFDLELGYNNFHGTIPASAMTLPQIQLLELTGNAFTGTIPDVNQALSITTLAVGLNQLTGTLPQHMGSWGVMGFLMLEYNLFEGTLPASFAQLQNVVELDVESNFLTGTFPFDIDTGVYHKLQTLNLNINRFTGPLPDQLFGLNSLNVITAVSNCFDLQALDAMCESQSLVTIALDGIRSGKTCRTELLNGLTSAYTIKRPLSQTIPECMFHMKNLTALHLSGNGLTGRLPENISIGSLMTDLSLSHNMLTGTVPHAFQARQWTNLDLSFNRLTGTLLDTFGTDPALNQTTAGDASISLENNRFSGRIPDTLLELQTVSVLGSNVFECNQERGDLPEHDKGSSNYHCGSNSFDIPYYVWLALCGVCLVLLTVVVCTRDSSPTNARLYEVRDWTVRVLAVFRSPDIQAHTGALAKVMTLHDNTSKLALVMVVCIVVVLLPFYAAVTGPYGTYHFQYAWFVSAAYLSGTVPAAVLMVLLVSLLCVLLTVAHRFEHRSVSNQRADRRDSRWSSILDSTRLMSLMERCGVYALFSLISISVVVGVNIGYVLVVLYTNTVTVVLVQVLLAFFKLLWNNFCSKYLLHWTISRIYKSSDTAESLHGREFHFVQLVVSLVNSIAIPCLVVAVVSPNCFYNLFVAAPVVNGSYQWMRCITDSTVTGECDDWQLTTASTEYDPPFIYNFQCSSSIVTYYAPAFVYLCITATFLNPLAQLAAMYLLRSQYCPASVKRMLPAVIPRILQDIDEKEAPVLNRRRPVLDANRSIIMLLSLLGMLLTFGAVFPPLAVAFTVTIVSIVYLLKLQVGSYLSTALEKNALEYVKLINTECERLARLSVLLPSVWIIITASCLFYTIFLFDTLGDAVGFGGAYWVLIVMPLMPTCMYAVYKAVVFVLRRIYPQQINTSVSDSTVSPLGGEVLKLQQIEMSDTGEF